ncbi:MAG TPA: two pore domain potassium channel family protein [Desulfarculaceae bacterium]|nr:two pore domain potassium channel family protein [Desulfarculaceae bacterium]
MEIKKKFNLRFQFQNLLVWMLLYILVSPFLGFFPHTEIFVHLLFTIVLISAVYAINQKTALIWPALVLLIITTILIWCHILDLFTISDKMVNIVLLSYLGLLITAFTRYVFTAKMVNTELVAAALCLYLLMGLFGGEIFLLLETFIPGSFSGSSLAQLVSYQEKSTVFQYFSFTTMTTLGYGDITPQTSIAMAFCQVEAILGQLFIAVLVARLVGIQVAQSFTKSR